MAQKVNPISLRLNKTNRKFDNCWYTDYFYRKLVSRDIYLQQYINNFLKLIKYPSARFSIQYSTKNIKLSSFLCYPKQSRELRSRMFGVNLKKKRKNNIKKRFQFHSLLPSKKITSRFSKRQKTLKFLGDHRLWSTLYNPYNFLEKVNIACLKNKQVSPSNIDYSNLVTLRAFDFSMKSHKESLVPYSVLINKNQAELKKKNSLVFFVKQKTTTPGRFAFKQASRSQWLYFIKNFVINLFFIKILNITKSKKFSQQFLLYTGRQNQPYTNCNIEYRKNFIKFFLVFYLLYTEYNRNTCFSTNTSVFCFTKNNDSYTLFAQRALDFQTQTASNHKESIDRTNYIDKVNIQSLKINKLKNQKFEKLLHNIFYSIQCFSFFQPVSFFRTTFQKNAPINLLLYHNTNIYSSEFLSEKPFYSVNRARLHSENGGLHSKNGDNLGKNLYILQELNSLLQNKEQQISLFSQIKKVQQQELKYKNYIEHFLSSQFNINTEFLPFAILQDWQSAGFLADEIVYYLERRVAFRRLKQKIIKKISENSNIRGIRISCSGRVGGKSKKAQRAKTECLKYGQTSRHTFSSRIDFAVRTARTIFGSVGIKVWICYN